MSTREFNFDGLIGPTHNFAGLAFGNVASARHQNQPSQPRAAALQGLRKMKLLASLGVGQCVLPPLRRPRVELLRELGFAGADDAAVIKSAFQESPFLVAASFSAASMWAANAATVSPSADTSDQRLHLTPANLTSTLHRSVEGPSTMRLLRSIFSDSREFQVHPPLPAANSLNDEGPPTTRV
jgi:succinylarginine dihydrolase